MVKPLPPRQEEVLDLIEAYIETHGYAPSFDEIRDELALKSKGTIYQHLSALEKRGYIIREPHTARSITLTSKRPPRALDRAKKVVNEAKRIDDIYFQVLLVHLATLTRAKGVCLHLVDWDEQLLVPHLWQGCWPKSKGPYSFAFGEGIAGHVWATQEAYVSKGDVHDDPKFKHSSPDDTKSLMMIPIFSSDRHDPNRTMIGTISLDSNKVDRFSERLMSITEELVQRVASTVESMRWFDQALRDNE